MTYTGTPADAPLLVADSQEACSFCGVEDSRSSNREGNRVLEVGKVLQANAQAWAWAPLCLRHQSSEAAAGREVEAELSQQV